MKKAHDEFRSGIILIIMGIIAPFLRNSGGIIMAIILIVLGIFLVMKGLADEDEADIQDQTQWGNVSRDEAELNLLRRKQMGAYPSQRYKYDARINEVKQRIAAKQK